MKVIIRIIKWVCIIFGFILFNFLVTEYLLKVNGIFESIHEATLDSELKSADRIFDFTPEMEERLLGLKLGNKFDLESQEKKKHIPYAEAENYNPYPPILHLFKSDYVIYSKESAVKQITILSGESDTTPSVLVSKSRGNYTGGGDYFVTYIFYQNNINVTNGVVKCDYDNIDWYSFRGGSYNGFEEAWFVVFTFFEILIIIIWLVIKKRKTSKNTYLVSK
ncbi:hypothetical protein [Algibacter sp. R77976]|uniref:hypothetical protein n=1 Tax=Algibacter sp. R77976 TaxID=3093873 RepID=UPI0037C731CA